MNILLDTQICLWLILDDPRLGAQARALIADARQVYVSSVSLWEIEIKHSLGKLPVGAERVRDHLSRSGADFLPVLPEHCLALAALPRLHGDPFDRMLVAQAMTEPLNLVTHDAALKGYPALIHLI